LIGRAALTRRKTVENLSANQRTVLELVILLGMSSLVCYFLLRMFVVGRAG
jgi:hypothetical protein